ncbi:NAD(P)/FAD-dependent oxidoreductase [Glaciimonas sp. PCH181]|nr:NAD(P)/FAD-dependent oxidoreductase [Glaciimonas sp. PCH181]
MLDNRASSHRYDVVIIGGGHNGLVAAAYLGRAGLSVAVLEARESLGGPCGTYEFMPGYRTSLTNSPGSFEARFVSELELARFGLQFVRTDPTVVHHFSNGSFIGWRDRERIVAQLNQFAPGEADRYFGLLHKLEELGRAVCAAGVSIFSTSPNLIDLEKRLSTSQHGLFKRVFQGSLKQLLDEELASEEAKALLSMVALNATLAPPSACGTAIGLMMRPLSLASMPPVDAADPRLSALRGSTGLPLGGMGAIIDALEACCLHYGVVFHKGTPVEQVLHHGGRTIGVASTNGDEYFANTVISTINPKTLFTRLLDDQAVGATIRREISSIPMRGSAFKIALALDRLPRYSGLPSAIGSEVVAGCQFRIGPSMDYIERAVMDGLSGVCSHQPIMWGLISSVTSPGVAPKDRHLLSVNVWHAPYELAEGNWETEKQLFGQRCIDTLAELMPDLRECIVGQRFMSPVELESELGLVHSNITHGDMLPNALFGARPHQNAHDYRTPLKGLYLSGAGTWPGGYVTGIPGFNASNVVIRDLANS